MTSDPLIELREALRAFAAERAWDEFHSPKNLAISLSVEAAEVLEHFQWITEDDSRRLSRESLLKVEQEMADILLYLVRLSDKLGVDLLQAAQRKMKLNAEKYPVDKSKGTSKKYTDF